MPELSVASCDASTELALSNTVSPHLVLIAKADRLYGECLRNVVGDLLPTAEVSCVTTLTAAQAWVEQTGVGAWLICGVAFRDGDALSWLAEVAVQRRFRRILVVTARKELWVHSALRAIPVDGVFNAFEGGAESLAEAFRVAETGGYFLSSSFRGLLLGRDSNSARIFRQLTLKEQLVLSVIGDGSDDHEAAKRLEMSPAAVRSHRKRLHVKLGVAHKGELMREAIRYGFVRMSAEGVVRPGFQNLRKQASSAPGSSVEGGAVRRQAGS